MFGKKTDSAQRTSLLGDKLEWDADSTRQRRSVLPWGGSKEQREARDYDGRVTRWGRGSSSRNNNTDH